MTNAQKQVIDAIVESYKKTAEEFGVKVEVEDYETFIKNNPDAAKIDIKVKILPSAHTIPIEFVTGKETEKETTC